jgi:hypothetical protein
MALLDTLAGSVFERTLETLLKPSTPVSNHQAEQVADKVTQAVKPVIENATNSEPWYRSRIYIGLIVAGLGAVAQHFGVQVSGSDLQLVANSVPELVQLVGSLAEVLGLIYAAYGRSVGSRKAALGK